ncbi:MAG: polyphosphate polymerase domain-containing protein, partial [Oscillospiraceae bacterium]|nr:polyphosphate polymerase domain-containing protein [Oscillospiraceae bacterium]
MKYRHEWKHKITYGNMLVLRGRLSAIAKRDKHTANGKYEIRSLYFDTLTDKALREKTDGVNIREKFRIRYYNGDLSFIRLEKKSKINGLCLKESTPLSVESVQAILDGNYSVILRDGQPLITEFYSKITGGGLRPKTIVDYTR